MARCGPDAACDVIECVPLAGGTFSAQFVPQLADLLSRHGASRDDLGGFAVVSGPGSFTGLRVGLAAVKALADALNRPIAAVSLLEAVAASSSVTGRVVAALDAGREEIYAGQYMVLERAACVAEKLLDREGFLPAVAGMTVVTPDPNVAELARLTAARVIEVVPPDGSVIARLGWPKILAGEIIPPDELEANYLRRSDAEIFTKLNS